MPGRRDCQNNVGITQPRREDAHRIFLYLESINQRDIIRPILVEDHIRIMQKSRDRLRIGNLSPFTNFHPKEQRA